MKIEIIDSLEQMKEIETAWNKLLFSSSSRNVFLTWEWQYSWAKTILKNSKGLFIIIVYSKNKLIGIAPWYIKKFSEHRISFRQLTFIGTPEAGSDYLDVILKNGTEREITNRLLKFLFLEVKKYWDIIKFSEMPSNSLFFLYLLEFADKEGKYFDVDCSSFCPRIKLPGINESFLSMISPRRRQKYRRDSRILKKNGQIGFVSEIKPSMRDIEIFFNFFKNQTGYQNNTLEAIIEKFNKNSSRESIQIDSLYDGKNRIASLLHFRFEQVLYMFIMAVNKNYNSKISLGNILVGNSIENAILRGFKTYDFLKGSENYKFHWANSLKTSMSVTIYGKRRVAGFLFLIRSLKKLGKIILR